MSTGPSARLFGRQHFWVRLVLLVVGIGGLRLSHQIASGTTTSRTAALVAVALAAVVWSTWAIVVSALSGAYRVFRSRHLLVCAALLGSAAVMISSLVVHGPFDRLFAHGRITGEDVADFGSVLAAFVCAVGTAIAATGAWEAMSEERHWHRSPYPHNPHSM